MLADTHGEQHISTSVILVTPPKRLFLLRKQVFQGAKYSRNVLFDFELLSTDLKTSASVSKIKEICFKDTLIQIFFLGDNKIN